MSSSRAAQRILHIFSADSFIWWAMLGVSVLSLPTYVVVVAYGIHYEQQIGELLILALCCTISIYIGVHIYEMFDRTFLTSSRLDVLDAYAKESLAMPNYASAPLTEYEKYLQKISALNENTYTDADGTTKNVTYCRSCDTVDKVS